MRNSSFMYNLPYFKEKDQKVLIEFIHQHPFALVCGCDASMKPVASQIPVFFEEKDGKLILSGHIMRQTDHHKAFMQNPNVLCVFTGPHAYVSATWYTNPNQASTWNYMSVQVKGQMRFLDEQALVEVLRKTSLHFEGYNTNSPTAMDNLPVEYLEKLMKAIVAFEVEVEEMDHVFKLSQNKDLESFENIVSKLQEGSADDRAVATEMLKRKNQLFG